MGLFCLFVIVNKLLQNQQVLFCFTTCFCFDTAKKNCEWLISFSFWALNWLELDTKYCCSYHILCWKCSKKFFVPNIIWIWTQNSMDLDTKFCIVRHKIKLIRTQNNLDLVHYATGRPSVSRLKKVFVKIIKSKKC